MTSDRWQVTGRALQVIVLFTVAFLVACAPSAPVVPAPTPSVAVAVTHVVATRAATLISPTRTPITTTGTLTLTLWTSEDFAPGTSSTGRALRNQFDAFSAANPNIYIDVVLKKPYGKGGLLDFLQMTHAVVPALLPDLIALDLAEVPLAAEAGILQPLDGLMQPDLKNDVFPCAIRAAHYQNQWVGYPFTVDAQHLVYNKTTVKKAPQTWDDVIKQKTTLLLPVGGADAFLLQHLALAPSPDVFNPLVLDVTATAQVLNFFKRGRDLGLLPETAIGLKTVEEVWLTFAAGQAAMAQVSASRFLAEREKFPNVSYASVPTRDGKIATIATGWAFAITSADPARQAASARFIQWLVQGERLAPWLRAARRLPASRNAMALVVDPPEYAAFLRDVLERAAHLPPASSSAKPAEQWRAAVAAVWKGQMTPEEAARTTTASSR